MLSLIISVIAFLIATLSALFYVQANLRLDRALEAERKESRIKDELIGALVKDQKYVSDKNKDLERAIQLLHEEIERRDQAFAVSADLLLGNRPMRTPDDPLF